MPGEGILEVAALAHPGGRLAFVSWQGLQANEWLTVIASEVANRVEIPEFGGLSKGPGMFALMDQDETTELLEAAGFTGVAFEPLAPTVLIGGGGTVDQSMAFLLRMGMARGLVDLAGTGSHDKIVEALPLVSHRALRARCRCAVGGSRMDGHRVT
jgi:hypothetical protein